MFRQGNRPTKHPKTILALHHTPDQITHETTETTWPDGLFHGNSGQRGTHELRHYRVCPRQQPDRFCSFRFDHGRLRSRYPPPPASGLPRNTIRREAGDTTYVEFTIGDATSLSATPLNQQTPAMINALGTVARLRVTLEAVSANGTEVMIARTSNSQGLRDVGTLSLLLTGINGTSAAQFNSATFRFDWFSADGSTALVGNNQMILTSYDLDYGQRNRIDTADYAAIGINTVGPSPTSELTISTLGTTTTIVDSTPTSDSGFSEVKNGYAFVTKNGDTTQRLSVDKIAGTNALGQPTSENGNQLYMISFRSPSPLVPAVVPEPSSIVIAGLGALALLRRRRA